MPSGELLSARGLQTALHAVVHKGCGQGCGLLVLHTCGSILHTTRAAESKLLINTGLEQLMATEHALAEMHAHVPVDPALQSNIDAFCSQLDSLLATHFGKYVVFANSRLFKVCSSLESALTDAYATFGAGPFLVQRVEPLRTHIDFQATCRV